MLRDSPQSFETKSWGSSHEKQTHQRSNCGDGIEWWSKKLLGLGDDLFMSFDCFSVKTVPFSDFNPFRFYVEFKLESRTPHCTVENQPHTHWMRYITEGFKVCVACEPPALRNSSGRCQGDGQESDKYEAFSPFRATSNICKTHIRWVANI